MPGRSDNVCDGATCMRYSGSQQYCFRSGGPEGMQGCMDACLSKESSNPAYPYKLIGAGASRSICGCCFTGDDGSEETDAFAVEIDMPEGADLFPFVYALCCNISCYQKYPECCGGTLEAELCMYCCLRCVAEAECTACPAFSLCRFLGGCVCCDFQRPDNEDSVVFMEQAIMECIYCCEMKSKVGANYNCCYNSETGAFFCLQTRCQTLCCVIQSAFPTTPEVPLACACCGTYCMGEEEVMAVNDNKTAPPVPKGQAKAGMSTNMK